ncbi:MAG: TIGR02597 family protein, partial [Verrucomicrobiales bacterium]|nr:TIGR02597 family protein [Verrucomicrobiales bacterium]
MRDMSAMQAMKKTGERSRWWWAVMVSLMVCAGAGAQVTISDVGVANVGTSGFSVCWRVDTETVPGLDVFSDAAGTVSLNGEVGVEFYPVKQNDTPLGNTVAERVERRELVALMKAEQLVLCDVTGVEPGVTYYVRPRSYDAGGVDNAVALAGLVSVNTAGETGFVWESRQLVVNFATAGIDAKGMVAELSKVDAAYPLVSVVGDHGLGNKAYFDLSDLLTSGGSTSLELSGTPEFSVTLKGLTSTGDSNTRQITLENDFVVAGSSEVPFSISTDPNLLDSDGDLIPDVDEVAMGSDPNDASDASADGDGDGIPLVVEWALKLDADGFDVDPLSIDLRTGGDGKLYPCIEYHRASTAALGLTLTVKDSLNLASGSWGDLAGASQALDPQGDDDGNPYRVEVEVTPGQAISDPGAPDRVFYQLCVEGVVAGQSVSWCSKPVGVVSTAQLADADRFTSVPFHRQPAFNGLVASASGDRVSVQGSPDWGTSPKQFVFAAGVQEERYFACVISGAKAGYLFKVVDNGASSVTLDLNGNSLDGVVEGDLIVVVPYWTLDTIFPNGRGITASVTPSDLRTVVFKPDFDAAGTNQSA